MKGRLLIPLASLLLAGSLCGCNVAGYLGYLVAPKAATETVEAEFDALKGHSVAVVVYCDQRVQYEHPWANMEVSHAIVDELRENVKHVTVLDPRRVTQYQGEHLRWETMDKTRIGSDLDVEYVLYVTLIQFTTRQPGAMHLYQGHIEAEASVWDVSLPERQARLWYGRGLTATYPEDPIGKMTEDDREIRYRTERIFAEKLVKNFYEHKVAEDL